MAIFGTLRGQETNAIPAAAETWWRLLPLPIQYQPIRGAPASHRLTPFAPDTAPRRDYLHSIRKDSATLAGAKEGHLLGMALQFIKRDGGGDSLAVGVRGFSLMVPAPSSGQSGRIMIFPGGPDGLVATNPWAIDGPFRRSFFGSAMSSISDLNGDGHEELLVGAPNTRAPVSQAGHAFLYRSAPADDRQFEPKPSWDAHGKKQAAHFGWSGQVLGDVNGDKRPDLLVGSPGFKFTLANEGSAVLFLGIEGGFNRSAAWTWKSESLEARFGSTILPVGDITGDGLADVLVAAPEYVGVKYRGGRIYMFSGQPNGLSEEPVWILEGGQTYGALGTALVLLKNRDGSARMAVSAPGRTDKSADGIVFIFEFAPGGLPVGPVATLRAEQEGSLFGGALASGDLNGDGWADLAIGAPAFSGAASRIGRTYVFHGTSHGFVESPDWIIEGASLDDQCGTSLASNGDLNGDGFDELAVGSPFARILQSRAGRTDIFHGSPEGLRAQPVDEPALSAHRANTSQASKTPWILTGWCISMGLILMFRHRRKSRLVTAAAAALIKSEREKIARNLHDDLGGELARVLALSRTAAGNANRGGGEVSPAEVVEAAEDLNETVGRIIWALHPDNDSLERFIEYIGADLERLCRKRGLRIIREIPLEIPHLHLPRNFREELHLAVKEIATNSIRHSGGDEFHFIVSVGDDVLKLTLSDNGSGLDLPVNARRGHGLNSLEARLTSLGGKVRVQSNASGTEINLTVPLISSNGILSGSPKEGI